MDRKNKRRIQKERNKFRMYNEKPKRKRNIEETANHGFEERAY